MMNVTFLDAATSRRPGEGLERIRLTYAQVQALMPQGCLRLWERGQRLVELGTPAKEVHIIVWGLATAEVCAGGGDTAVVDVLGAGEVLGAEALCSERAYRTTSHALTAAITLRIPVKRLQLGARSCALPAAMAPRLAAETCDRWQRTAAETMCGSPMRVFQQVPCPLAPDRNVSLRVRRGSVEGACHNPCDSTTGGEATECPLVGMGKDQWRVLLGGA